MEQRIFHLYSLIRVSTLLHDNAVSEGLLSATFSILFLCPGVLCMVYVGIVPVFEGGYLSVLHEVEGK